MKKYICIFGFLLLSQKSFGDCSYISLESIVAQIEQGGIEHALLYIEKNECFDKSTREIILSNKIEYFSDGVTSSIKWQTSNVNGNEFTVSIPLGQYSFVSPLSDPNKYNIIECDANMVTSGTKIMPFKKNNYLIAENWFCGSLGCSYSFTFSKYVIKEIKTFCQ